ncbi:hypothetical protein ES319_A03G032000v1 [Gossypium barbadense]|uniref:Copia protein n=2 Tax=Gossypium TaxID=3633 RepID=A0A5J5WBG1_GOSBA|nr:hypothetical protein ES319_A03G032000v1 [Gossypium barbadense]TYH23715.1 hypothetical protein ES288_A03G035800v1 [Gossypium darwinii]
MSANLTHHARVKHVEIDHHFVREKVLDGTLQVNYVPSANQVVDVLTKPIPLKQFAEFRHALQVTPVNTIDSNDLQERKEPGEC